MSNTPVQREFFLDSIRAWLMILGIPFHISLIYSTHQWHINSVTPSLWLTIFNDFIHAFRMQVFFVISGYFSWMLYLRYNRKRWWVLRTERVAVPMLASIPLLTLPQFFLLQHLSGENRRWGSFTLYQKYNTLVWELISHLWFLLVLVILTTLGLVLFQRIKRGKGFSWIFPDPETLTLGKLSVIFLLLGLSYAALRRLIFIFAPQILSDGLFNFTIMQPLFYLPFFLLGALAFKYPLLKARFIHPHVGCWAGSLVGVAAYMLNQHYGSGDKWLYETDSVITMLLGVWMVNVVFSFGHTLLNSHSPRVTYFVNASLFIYLVHHPLTLIFGGFIMPHIASNTLGFLAGMVFVMSIAIMLYEIHLRIPVLRFLFSGKPQRKCNTVTV
ncbi:glucan biosynthesis protein C [Mangrovibacter phragmitis]|uniref:Glucans biosynthesis protein C n=1 Tax=Mangrovibacter phragmitis TaxID=1691903 RepID=A0A1B7KXZ5_9ENTR|nr:glucans biosynthesis protein MdoC [Mangrovibacter phragmitis]OAT75022.1 glucan biosynthesis protein C [Mangrovibacter phragmitis]